MAVYKFTTVPILTEKLKKWEYDYQTATYLLMIEKKQKGLSMKLTPGNPNQMESGDQISGGPRRTANLGPWQVTISNTCITCGIIAIIVLAILFLLTLAVSIFSLVVFLFNGDASGNWNVLTTFPEYEAIEATADREY